MQKRITLSASLLLVACAIITLSGCFKDTATKQYKVYTPVFKTTAEVRNGIKSNAPQPVNTPGKMYLFGNYIFLNELNRGIHVIDNSNPSSPVNKAFINIPGNVDIAVKGNTLYADCYTDLFVLDITNINNVTLQNYMANIFPERRYAYGYYADSGKVIVDWLVREETLTLDIKEGQGIWRDGNFVTGGGMWGGPWIFNSVASSSPGMAVSAGVGGSMARFAIIDNYMYAVTTSQLKTLNIANSNAPQLMNSKNVGWNIETIYPFKNKLFLGSQLGMYIFDLNNPSSPVQGMMFGHARACDPVVADDNYAYVTLHSGSSMCWTTNNELNVVNIQNLSSPSLLKTYPLSGPKGLSKQGNTLFICDGDAGLKVFDATDAANILLRKTIPMNDAYDVIALPSNIAIVSAKSGLYQYSFNSPTNVTLLSKISVQQ
jgi:hypothetical protein